MFWGYSPAIELLSAYKLINSLQGKTELNFLIAGSADARHILKTISKYYTHQDAQNITINFYVVDLLLEFIAREILLILIALEPSDKIGLKEKANLWMEIFGNSLLRPTSAEYLIKKAFQLTKIVTNKKYQLKRIPCLNFDQLKYKEKDQLELIFKFWIKNNFNMPIGWDDRLRRQLKERYDTKMGAFDWDYFMNLKDIKDGDKVNSREYKQWRNTGIAFTWLEKEFSVSNPTLALGIESDGDKLLSMTYLGDITSGPFYCFGTECEDSEMLIEINNTRPKRATDITERNLMRIFHEIEHNTNYKHVGDDRNLGNVVTQMAKLNFNDTTNLSIECENIEEDYSALNIKHKIIFLPINTLEDAAKLVKFHRFFDLMVVGQGLLQRLNTDVLAMVKDNGPILMETRKFLLLKKDALEKFEEDVKSVMKQSCCKPVGSNNFNEDNHAVFVVKLNEQLDTNTH